jgi:threonine/homoserine/homoserine lactone efflux protein
VDLYQSLLSFGLVAGLLTLVPGIDTALVLRSSLARTRGFAFATALGISTGLMVWGIAAAVGVSALLAASDLAYRALTIAGAAYMVWLGASLLWKSRAKDPSSASPAADVEVPAASRHQLFQGWLTGTGTNLLNPKVGVFYIATIPQFIPPGTPPLLMGILLAGVHCVLGLAWLTFLIFGASFASKWLKSARSLRIIDRITGTVLIGFGLRLALEPRH